MKHMARVQMFLLKMSLFVLSSSSARRQQILPWVDPGMSMNVDVYQRSVLSQHLWGSRPSAWEWRGSWGTCRWGRCSSRSKTAACQIINQSIAQSIDQSINQYGFQETVYTPRVGLKLGEERKITWRAEGRIARSWKCFLEIFYIRSIYERINNLFADAIYMKIWSRYVPRPKRKFRWKC